MSSTAIMTQTLPTIVGMGVVSETTRTMFGKGSGRGRRRATTQTRGRRPRIASRPVGSRVNTRRFNGKLYREANWHTTRAVADRDAQYFRLAGHPARVVKQKHPRTSRQGYAVYVG